MPPKSNAVDDESMVLTEGLVKYATGQFDLNGIQTAVSIPMLNIVTIAPDALAGCALSLTSLDLSHNRLVSLDGMQCLKALQILNVAVNRLVDLDPLQQCTALEVLHAEGNLIANFDTLQRLGQPFLPALRAIYLQKDDGSQTNPICQVRSLYVERMKQYFAHLRCWDGHYFCKEDQNPVYVDAGGDREIVLPPSQPWVSTTYFENVLIDATKIGVIPEKSFQTQVMECKRVLQANR